MREVTGRAPLRSPGAPSHPRAREREFWAKISTGLLPTEAGVAIGVAPVVGSRWFRQSGGMSPYSWPAPSGRYLSLPEREEIAILKATGVGVRAIARALGRSPSTISRELRRNAATRGGKLDYRASVAQWKAELFARRPKVAKLVANPRLREYVQERLSGQIRRPDGRVAPGPQPPRWTGQNKPHRKDRAWVLGWSPEQIANRIKLDFPDDDSMRISHEAIYQALFIEKPWSAEARAHPVPAYRESAAYAAGAVEAGAVGACHRRCRDQRAARRGGGPGDPRPPRGRPHYRHQPVRDRHRRRADHGVPRQAVGRIVGSGKLGTRGSASPVWTSTGRFQDRASCGLMVL